MMPLTSEYQELCNGLLIRRAANRFAVLRLHYVAHPDRAKLEWAIEERKKYEPHVWEQEQEINWKASGGEKVLSNFDRSIHLIDPMIIPRDAPIAVICDPGYRNYLAVCFYTLDAEDNVYQFDEIYARKLFVNEACNAIKAKLVKYNREFDDCAWKYIDKEAKSIRHGQPVSTLDQYKEQGLKFNLAPQVTDIDGHNRIRTMLHNSVLEKQGLPKIGPAFYITKNCINTALEFENLSYRDSDGDMNKPEKAMDKNNHTIDCAKNFFATNPKYSSVHVDTELTQRVWDINKETHRRLTQ